MPPDYLVTTSIKQADANTGAKVERLVRAKNEAAAIKHVVADTIQIDRASIDDAMRLAKIGVEVENAA